MKKLFFAIVMAAGMMAAWAGHNVSTAAVFDAPPPACFPDCPVQ